MKPATLSRSLVSLSVLTLILLCTAVALAFPALLSNFESQDNATGNSPIPPDANLAVGPNHLMQLVNGSLHCVRQIGNSALRSHTPQDAVDWVHDLVPAQPLTRCNPSFDTAGLRIAGSSLGHHPFLMAQSWLCICCIANIRSNRILLPIRIPVGRPNKHERGYLTCRSSAYGRNFTTFPRTSLTLRPSRLHTRAKCVR